MSTVEKQVDSDGMECVGDGPWQHYYMGSHEFDSDLLQRAADVAESLLEHDGLNLPDIFARFQRWATDEPKDVGLQTEDVLTRGLPWDQAAAAHYPAATESRVMAL